MITTDSLPTLVVDVDGLDEDAIVPVGTVLVPCPVVALRLRLRSPSSAVHSAWLAHVTNTRRLQGGRDTNPPWVYASRGPGRPYEVLTQFSLAQAGDAITVIAVGHGAAECLAALVDAEKRYDASMFDADGFPR